MTIVGPDSVVLDSVFNTIGLTIGTKIRTKEVRQELCHPSHYHSLSTQSSTVRRTVFRGYRRFTEVHFQ